MAQDSLQQPSYFSRVDFYKYNPDAIKSVSQLLVYYEITKSKLQQFLSIHLSVY
jgi:hypothetical protein